MTPTITMHAHAAPLAGARIALLVEDDFEDGEVFGPRDAFRAAGADVVMVGPTAPTTFHGKHGAAVESEITAGRAKVDEFDAVVIPGGWAPDRMRMRHAMVDLVREFASAGKPVAAICHGPQMLISAKLVRDRMVTCWPSIAVDIKNAGGLYMDKPVIDDHNIITSRKLDDVPAFSDAVIQAVIRRRSVADR